MSCQEGNAGNDVLDLSLSAYGTGVYDVEMLGGDGVDTVGFVGDGGIMEAGAIVDVEMSGDAGDDFITFGGIMPCIRPGSQFHVAAVGNEGNDLIAASLQFLDDIGGRASFAFAGGSGDDRIVGEIMPCLLPGGELQVILDGNEGNDSLLATLRDAHMDGLFELDLYGGTGADSLFAGGIMPCIIPEAMCQIHLVGDAGNDTLVVDLAFQADFLGELDFSMDGGLGDDRLTAFLPFIEQRPGSRFRIDGGAGRDIANISRNMLLFVINCEEIIPLD